MEKIINSNGEKESGGLEMLLPEGKFYFSQQYSKAYNETL